MQGADKHFFRLFFSHLEVKMKRLKISQRFKNSPEQNEEIMNRTYTGRYSNFFSLGCESTPVQPRKIIPIYL